MFKQITVENFIDILAKSDDKILQSMSENISVWNKLKHNKECLELFLNNNVAEIHYKTKTGDKKRTVACSNTTLIKMFSLKKDTNYNKKLNDLKKMKSKGIHTRDTTSVLSWNFLRNGYVTINLKDWQIGRFITINDDNISILNETLKNLLENPKRNEAIGKK